MEINAGILAIGNEVVEGQITNRNASWLSQELMEIGLNPKFHFSCKDVPEDIHSALNFLAKQCHLIVTTGGLGPTQDDLTKEALAQWSGTSLILNEEQWKIIQEKLAARQVQLRDGHKRQAHLPKGAWVLGNSPGVAPGFFLKSPQCFLACLPGPPYEMQTMFNEHLRHQVIDQLKPKSQKTLHTWICLGAAESEVSHIAESVIGDSLSLGFRLHKPYVEIKIWVPDNPSTEQSKRLKVMEEKLQPWLVGRSIKEIRKKFHEKLTTFENVFVIDHLSQGLLFDKLKEDFSSDHLRYQCFEHKAFRFFTKEEIAAILKHMQTEQSNKQLFISLFPESENSALLALNNQIESIKLPRKISVQSRLGRLYVIEKSFLKVIGS